MEVVQRLYALFSPDYLMLVWGSLLMGLALFHSLERAFPARQTSLKGFLKSAGASVCYLAFAPLIAVIPSVFVFYLVKDTGITLNMQVLAFWFDEPKSLPYQPSVLAIVVMTLLWLFIYDFFWYWFHRLQHTKLLWWQHKFHHEDEHFSVATSWRVNWLDESLRTFFVLLPMGLLLNVTLIQATWMAYITAQLTYFAHANIRLSLGPLTPLFIGPQYHRIHHSLSHQNKNFAGTFPVLDLLFGTYYRPLKGEFPETGVRPSA